MPAVAEQAVVCPVGCGRANGNHGDVVNQEHDDREDRKTQPAVGDDLIDLIRGGQAAHILFLVAVLDELCDVDVALVGDDGLGVVVELFFGCLDVLLDMGHHVGRNLQLLKHLVVALEDLDGEPALLLFGLVVDNGLFDVGNRVLHGAGEGVHRDGLGALGSLDGGLSRFHDARALQGGDLNDLAAKLTAELCGVDLVAVLADNVHHVDGDDNRNAELGQLSR